MCRIKILIAVLIVSSVITVQSQTLSEGAFRNAERNFAPMTWWHWINGNVTKQGIRKDLVSMHTAGLRGVQLFNVDIYLPKGPVCFGSDEWAEMVKYAVEICDSLDLKFVIMNSAGWSGSGGPWINAERAMKKLVYSETKVIGNTLVDTQLPEPITTLNYYKDVAIIAVPAEYLANQIDDFESKILMKNSKMLQAPDLLPEKKAIPIDQVINLSSYTDNGHLQWHAPKGEWTIIRFGYTLTGKMVHPTAYGGEGLEVDKLNAESVQFQFNQCLGKLLAATKSYLGNTFEGILFDSYEAGFQNWSATIPDEFRRLNNYDLIPYLPLFTGRPIESLQKSERVLFDFRHLLDELISNCYYGTMQRMAYQNNLIVYAEGQGGPLNPSKVLDFVDIPMNEFWNPDTKPRITKLKLIASMANLQGKQIVAAEAFTSKPEDARWQNTPWTMKKPGDLAFAAGINRFCFHTYTHQPLDYIAPGFTMGRYGTLFSRHSTWWNYAHEWISYITRSQYLLQQGRTVADICFLFHDDMRYNFPISMVELPDGFNYQIIYPKDILGAEYNEGTILLRSGIKCKLIVLAENAKMDLSTLHTLHGLVSSGAIISGNPPYSVPSQKEAAQTDKIQYNRLVEELWGGFDNKLHSIRSLGKGKIFTGYKTEKVIAECNLQPDVDFGGQSGKGNLFYLHRRGPGEDIYYLCSQSDSSISSRLTFRVTDRLPEFFDPITGKVSPAPLYSSGNGSMSVDIELDPCGALFVVFRKPLPPNWEKLVKSYHKLQLATTIQLNQQWKVTFENKRQMPGTIMMDKLSSWHNNENEQVKYYSGTAKYTTGFNFKHADLKKGEQCLINLGKLYNIARIELNGKAMGIVWKQSYRLEITDGLKAGHNELTIYVANTWINRLIGDEQFPSDLQYETAGTIFTTGRLTQLPDWLYSGKQPEDRKRITFTTWKHYAANSQLVPSGLLGPVQIEIYIR